MATNAFQNQLVLLARSGMMTHVADLAPPVTAEAMSRFRAEAAAQASNVMALGSGQFALCLGPGTLEIRSAVPHALRGISEVLAELDQGANADAVLQEAPGTSGTRVQAGHGQLLVPSADSGHGETVTRQADRIVSAVAEGQVHLARSIDDLAATCARLSADLGLAEDRANRQMAHLLERIDGIGAHLESRTDADRAALDAALSAQDGRARSRMDAMEARLAEGLEAVHAAQMEAMGHLSEDMRDATRSLAEQSVQQGEALATIRFSLRSVTDRVAEVSGLLRHGLAAGAGSDSGGTVATQESETAGADSGVTLLHPQMPGGPDPVAEAGAPTLAETARLRRAVADLLRHLDGDAEHASQEAESGARVLWQRSARGPRFRK